jgi:hypothetical protein
MDRVKIQTKLNTAYDTWKAELTARQANFAGFGPPLLLSVTEEYCQAETRIIVFGQETNGWEWDKNLRRDCPNYPLDWEFPALNSLNDFLSTPEGVEGLCWGYHEFAFAQRQPKTRRNLIWQAFREIQGLSGAGVMWNNLAKSEFFDPAISDKRSTLNAEKTKQAELYVSQRELFHNELAILDPHICLFLSGPNYDPVLEASFPGIKIKNCSDLPVREFAKLDHPALPKASFRTYHPIHLNRANKWGYIEQLKLKVLEKV